MSNVIFHNSSRYSGYRKGYVFKTGSFGLGYYKDNNYINNNIEFKEYTRDTIDNIINKLRNDWNYCFNCKSPIGENLDAADLIESLNNEVTFLRNQNNKLKQMINNN